MLSSDDPEHRSESRYAWCVCGLIVLAIGLIYGQTLRYPLLDYDDRDFVSANPHVTGGLSGESIRWALTDGPSGEWYPTTMLSHMFDVQLFGLRPWGHHLTNLLLHAAASLVLFRLLWQMTGELWPSGFVALVFAAHPQHVESVAWVAERRDVLSGLFFMLTLWAWLDYLRCGRTVGRYVLAAVLFALGLMAKPMLVTLPPLLLLLDFWPLARLGGASDVPGQPRVLPRVGVAWMILEKIPFFALAVGEVLMTMRTHVHAVPVAWPARLANATISAVVYIAEFFYPVGLAVFRPFPLNGHSTWKVAAAAAILAFITAAAVIWRRKLPYVFVGWFWYLGMMAPVIGIIQVADHAMADRYMYLPSIGLSIALTWSVWRLAARSTVGLPVVGSLAAAAAIALTICAAFQASFWRDDETLWRHTLAATTNNSEAELGLADALRKQGHYDEALAYYQRAQQLAPDNPDVYNNLGLTLVRQKKLDEAIAQYRRGLKIAPQAFRLHANLGIVLGQQGRLAESVEHFRQAVKFNPTISEAHAGLAKALFLDGKTDESLAEFARALEIDPGNATAHDDLAAVLLQQKKVAEAIPHLQAALAADPRLLRAQINLAIALTERGQLDQAMDHYRQALAIAPDNPTARRNLEALEQGNAGLLKP